MKAKGIYCFLVLILSVTGSVASDWGPVAVSPGRERGVAREMKPGVLGREIAQDFSLSGVEKRSEMPKVQGYEGDSNTFYGLEAGSQMTSGTANSFFGRSAGYKNTEGDFNTFIGFQAGYNNTDSANTFIGYGAGYNNTDSANTFIGYGAGYNNTTGYYNTFLGFMAGYYETGSNKLYIDNSDTSSPLIYGDFATNKVVINGFLGIKKKNPTHKLEVGTLGAYCDGGLWVDGSSRTYKENIEALKSGEAFEAFEELEPVKFNYKGDQEEKSLGFIAEDVPELVATKDRKGLSPMDVVAVLTKVVQEQQEMIKELRQRIEALEKGK